MRKNIKDTLLDALHVALSPHSIDHEYFTYDSIDIYIDTMYKFYDDELDEVEKFITEKCMYKYYDRLVFAINRSGKRPDTFDFKKLLALPDEFIKWTTQYMKSSEYIFNTGDPKYMKYILRNASIRDMRDYLTKIDRPEYHCFIKCIIEASKRFPFQESLLLLHDVSIRGDLIYEYINSGATSYQLIHAWLVGMEGRHYEDIIDGLTDIEVIRYLFNKGITQRTHSISTICMMAAGFEPDDDPKYYSDVYTLCPKFYDAYTKYKIKRKLYVNLTTDFATAVQINVATALHIYKNYMVSRGIVPPDYLQYVTRSKLTCPSMVRSLVELIYAHDNIGKVSLDYLMKFNIASVTNCIVTKYPNYLSEVERKMKDDWNDNSNATKRMLIRHERYVDTICPYENIDILNESHLDKLNEFPDIQSIIKSRPRKIFTMNSPYSDVDILCRDDDK